MPKPSFDELLQRLVGAEVRFVLVGGLAVSAWGVVRGTRDVDIVPDPDPENLGRLAELTGHLLSGQRAMIETELGALDVVHGLEGVPSYDELEARAVTAEILGVEVRVCALADLRAMKRATGRARDVADLEDLDAANEQIGARAQ